MAMRPDVRRHALVVIVFSLAQWFFMRYILANELFNLTTNQRILYFCVSSLVGALLIFGATSIFNFSLALLIGLVSGVISSVFIAVPLWGIMKKRELKKNNGKLVVHKEKKSNDEKILV